jgi:hypothetical protein
MRLLRSDSMPTAVTSTDDRSGLGPAAHPSGSAAGGRRLIGDAGGFNIPTNGRGQLAVLGILCAAFLLLAAWFSAATPPLEAGDEMLQFFAVRQIANTGSLPVLDPADRARPDSPHQEAGQPPLYHVLAALAIRGLDTDDVLSLTPNPHAAIGIPTTEPSNRNRVVHPRNEKALQSTQALNRARWVSTLFGLLTVVATFYLGRAVAPAEPAFALLGAAMTAFNPMFLFVSASVANDSAVAALSAFALLLLIPTVRGQLSAAGGLGQGLVIGLACLAKLSGLGLVPLALGAIAYSSRQRTNPGARAAAMKHGAALILGAALVSGWWFARNLALYGDPTAISAWLAVSGGRDRAFDFNELRGAWVGFWGVFGAFDILAPAWLYAVYAGLGAASLVGWIGTVIGGGRLPFERPSVALLAAWAVIETSALARWTTLTLASSGRLLFPAISAVAILLAIGLLFALQRSRRSAASIGAAGVAAVLAALIPPLALIPAYRPIPLASEADVASLQRIGINFGDILTNE